MEKTESHSQASAVASDFEADSQDHHLRSKLRSLRTLDGVRSGASALALLLSMTALGVAGNTLAVYDHTNVPSQFLLPLWPDRFNIRPTVALVAGSVFVLVANIVGLCFAKVQSLRHRATAHTSVSFAAPLVGFLGALIAIIFFYAVNASEEEDTLLSWTCRWRAVPMAQQPHWDSLCRQSHAALYLTVLLLPVEALALGLAVMVIKGERYVERYTSAKKSPALS